jgi:hypothetical protein
LIEQIELENNTMPLSKRFELKKKICFGILQITSES